MSYNKFLICMETLAAKILNKEFKVSLCYWIQFKSEKIEAIKIFCNFILNIEIRKNNELESRKTGRKITN